MLRSITVGLVTLITLVSLPAVAQQPACDARTEVIQKLNKDYSEKSTAMGLASNGGMVELMTSESEDSWTIIITLPNGTSCLIAAGQNWEAIPVLKQSGTAL